MPSYVIRHLSADLIARAKAHAREAETTLDAVLIRYLETYAQGVSAAAQLGASGGVARAAKMTRAERTASARTAARARWKDHVPVGS